jgi:arginyl-tRNA synthetase
MSLAKPLKQKPRDIATQIVEKLDLSDLCEPPEIAGPASSTCASRPSIWKISCAPCRPTSG